jgi:hypothetical protein
VGHTNPIYGVMFFRNNTTVLTGSADDTLGVWDVPSGKRLFTLLGHEQFICGLACSPDGSLFASSSLDQTIRIWDTASMQCINVVECEDRVDSLVFTPGSDMLIAGIGNSYVTAFEPSSGDIVRKYSKQPNSDRVYGLAYSNVAAHADDDVSALNLLPLPVSIAKGRELLAKAQRRTQAERDTHDAQLLHLKEEYDDKVAKLNARFEGKHASTVRRQQEIQEKVDEITTKLSDWENAVCKMPVSGLTTADVQLLCLRYNIRFDEALLVQNKVDGPLLEMCDTDDLVMSTLGIDELGSSLRLLFVVSEMKAGRPLPPARDILTDGNPADVSTWSVNQTSLWLSVVGLAALRPSFEKHLIAGDVLLDVETSSLGAVSNFLFLNVLH